MTLLGVTHRHTSNTLYPGWRTGPWTERVVAWRCRGEAWPAPAFQRAALGLSPEQSFGAIKKRLARRKRSGAEEEDSCIATSGHVRGRREMSLGGIDGTEEPRLWSKGRPRVSLLGKVMGRSRNDWRGGRGVARKKRTVASRLAAVSVDGERCRLV
jgi:hypothetical protein